MDIWTPSVREKAGSLINTAMLKKVPQGKPVPFLASKWLHIQLLIDPLEMQDLLKNLAPCKMYATMGAIPEKNISISEDELIKAYKGYIESLVKENQLEDTYRQFFTSAITQIDDAVVAIELADGRVIAQPVLPIIQMRPHRLDYSVADSTFRPMVFGEKTISWGVQMSYPQLFQFPETREVVEALDEDQFSNAKLFRRLQQWVRRETLPTPFEVAGVRTNVPMRIGKKCLSWINDHRELKLQGISVCKLNL